MKISAEIKRLLMMNASANIIFNYIGIFVNLYIWEKDKSIFDVTWFNLVMFITWTLFYIMGSKLMTYVTNRTIAKVIAFFGATTFLLLVLLHLDNRILWISIIAIPVGAMWGLYACIQNITVCMYGKGKDFADYFSLANINVQVISSVNPIIFALLIQWIGFNGSFLLMILFVTLLFVVSFIIPSISLAGKEEALFRDISFRKVFAVPSFRWLVPSCLTAGVILQFQNLFALLFTFSISEDKLVIALLNMLYTLSSIVGMVLYKKIKIKENAWFGLGMAALSAGFLLVLFPYAPILVASNILTTLGMFFFGTIFNTRQFAIISQSPTVVQARIFIWREFLLNISRIAMLLLILNIKDFHGAWFFVLLFIALFSAVLTPYFSKKGIDSFEMERQRI